MPEERAPDHPVVGVGVVVVRPSDRGTEVLLIRRGKAPRRGQWSLPGGRQELGESLAAAAAREVLEETGLVVADLELLDVVDSITRTPDGRVSHHYSLVDYLARWHGGDAVAASDAAELRWVDAAALQAYDLWSETQRIIALGLERARRHPSGPPEPNRAVPT